MSALPVRVVKIGGSLLALPEFGRQLRDWLPAQTPAVNVLIAGGGDLADVIRRWDAIHALGEEASHWLCIRALGITAEVVAAQLPAARICNSLADLRGNISAVSDCDSSPIIVFQLEHFLRTEEPALPPEPLPHNWSVTTDSLAARVAEVIHADELVLLKSIAPPDASDNHGTALASSGYVDAHFPMLAVRLKRIRCATIG